MKQRVIFEVEIPDEMFDHIIKTAGAELGSNADKHLALLAAATRQLPLVIREFLLAPEHSPPQFGTPICFTKPDSDTLMQVTMYDDNPPPAPAKRVRKKAAQRKKDSTK
jgi:hypothetical protein